MAVQRSHSPPSKRSRHLKGPYYARHRDDMLESQRQYNFIKRCGRRKMSKTARAALEAQRRMELLGLQPKYFKSIALPEYKGHDRLVRPEVRLVEQSRRVALRARLSLLCSEQPTRNQAHAVYAREVESQLLKTVNETHEYLKDLETNPFTILCEKFLHRQRRLVGGYHQELEYLGKGDDAYKAALQNRLLILEGHRIDRAAFKQEYGW